MYCPTCHKVYNRFLLGLFSLIFISNGYAQRPNIIYIMTDDMGYGDLSCYGRKDFKTPHLDKLASQGMKFLNAYSAAPICTPTRVAFMTGRYPARTPVGLIEPIAGTSKDSTYGLTTKYPSIGTMMKTAGYETALVGKWHLGFLPEHSPLKNGIDYFFGIHSGAADYVSHTTSGGGYDLYENDSLDLTPGYLTDLITHKANAFIKQKHNHPFFLTITYTAPHWPWQGPGDQPYADTMNFRQGGSSAIYEAMMKSLDEGIGSIMKTLDDEQLTANTIVIFTNDNGGEKYSDNGGLANMKGTLWEGGIRVPAFVRWPHHISAGTITDQPVITMDWTSTILSLAGAKPDTNFPLDGIDLMPVLTGRSKLLERTFYWRTFQRTKHKAIRMGDWKYLKDEKGEYLFNLHDDQEERHDRKEEQLAIFNRLKEKYAEWEKMMLVPIPL